MSDQNNDVIDHLKQAISHLESAINLTIQSIKSNPNSKKMLGKVWEDFLGAFFSKVRSKGKEHNINLLGLISFPKLRRFG
ncbi:hypothetical protein FZC66_14085 [Priestia megaterium]|nr:hypothetical protein FZC66_14085 [Priestia megaterium]